MQWILVACANERTTWQDPARYSSVSSAFACDAKDASGRWRMSPTDAVRLNVKEASVLFLLWLQPAYASGNHLVSPAQVCIIPDFGSRGRHRRRLVTSEVDTGNQPTLSRSSPSSYPVYASKCLNLSDLERFSITSDSAEKASRARFTVTGVETIQFTIWSSC